MFIRCNGARLRGSTVRPFELSAAQRVTVAWRQWYSEQLDDLALFLDAVQGRTKIEGLEVFKPLYVVDIRSKKASSKKAASILSSHTREQVENFAGLYGIDLRRQEHEMDGKPKLLLALESARLKHMGICGVVSGLDPMGKEAVRTYMERELVQHAVLEICPPTYKPEREEYPQGTIDVIPLTKTAGV
jgi:hypothetical protein